MLTLSPEELFVAELARDVWTPVEELTVSDWAERYRVLDEKSAGRPGKWDNSLTPYLVGVMNAFNDPTLRQITFMKASQLGGTEVINNVLAYIVAMAPAPTMIVYPNEKLASSVGRDRIKPMIAGCDELNKRLDGDSTDDMAALCLRFDRMNLYLEGAGSVTNLRSRPVKYVFPDDADLHPVGTFEECRQRTTTFPDGKIFPVGTPGMWGEGIHAEYLKSDQRFYAVPCPSCLAYQELIWERVKWDGGSHADPENVRRTAWYECASCRCKVDHSRKQWMTARGVWVADGEGVTVQRETPRVQLTKTAVVETRLFTDADGNEYRVNVSEGRRTSHAGFRISTLYSPFKSWGDVASEYVAARGRPPRAWWNGRIGRAYKFSADRIEEAELRQLVRPYEQGGYGFGTVPDRAIMLSIAIDVQHDRVWFETDWWGAGMREWGLVDCGWVASSVGDGLPAVDNVIGRTWPLYSNSSRRWRAIVSAVDSGDGRRTLEAYAAAKRNKSRGLHPVKGNGVGLDEKTFRVTKIEDFGIDLLLVGNLAWKQAVLTSHKAAESVLVDHAATEGATEINGFGGAGTRWLPHGTPPEYFEHYTSEELVPKNGRMVYQSRAQGMDGKNNHLLDCGKYAACLVSWLEGWKITENMREHFAKKSLVQTSSAVPSAAGTTAKNEPQNTPRGGPSMRMATPREMREAIRT